MDFEWNPTKARQNLEKHRVDFADTPGVFEDPLGRTTVDVRHEEERFLTIGTDFLGRLLVVVWMRRGRRIRIISARPATGAERRDYEG